MAKTLQSLINLAPSGTEEKEVCVHWFTHVTSVPGSTWQTYHGDAASGGGTKNVWTVPSGVSEITFHIWGSGGDGAASHCCMQGIPAGAGAYAKKKITSGFSAGDRYVMCLGDFCNRSCTSSAAGCCCPPGTASIGWDPTGISQFFIPGCRGQTTYVTGPGLTNFCAEGGNPGISVYRFIRGQYANCRDAGASTENEHCYNTLIKMCDALAANPDDSDSAVYRRACYYGADDGARGVWACFQNGCCGCFEAAVCNHHSFIMWLAQPGGKWWMGTTAQSKYGWTFGNHWYNCIANNHGTFGPHGTAERQQMAGSTIAHNNFDNGGAMIGVGGLTAWTCGGTCCCGGYGGPGAVVIQYK
jgi:hypothetical protein